MVSINGVVLFDLEAKMQMSGVGDYKMRTPGKTLMIKVATKRKKGVPSLFFLQYHATHNHFLFFWKNIP